MQETCDICDAVVFDVHWTCARCGFVVCVDCYEGYGFTKDSEDDDDQKGDENDWPTCCASRQSHEPDDLTMTRIIPCDGKQGIPLWANDAARGAVLGVAMGGWQSLSRSQMHIKRT